MLEARSVSGAADRLGLTQSALSKHLARLRATYDDALFVRCPEGMLPTPRAEAMAPHVMAILGELDALASGQSFDLSRLSGDVTVSTTDEFRQALLPAFLYALEKEAPQVRLNLQHLGPDYSAPDLQLGMVDLVIAVDRHAPPVLKQKLLMRDEFVCVMGHGHPLANEPLTLSGFAAASHVLVAPLAIRHGFVDDKLGELGFTRRVALSVPDFHSITVEILRDRHLVTLPRMVATRLVAKTPDRLAVYDLPFDLPGLDYFCFWHPRFDRDPRHLWIRSVVRRALGLRDA